MAIYGIEVGEYSGYEVIGYCTSEEEAAARCAMLNIGNRGRYDEYTYFEMKNLDIEGEASNDVWYKVEYRIDGGIDETDDCWTVGLSKLVPVFHYKEPIIKKVMTSPNTLDVTVRVRENSEDLAKKAVIDAYYKYLAEHNGL